MRERPVRPTNTGQRALPPTVAAWYGRQTSQHDMRRRYFLAFDAYGGAGAREHFFHYLWGYLLPAAHAITMLQADPPGDSSRSQFVFITCGPVMDTRTAEMARLLEVEWSIVEDEREAVAPGTTRLVVERWDSLLGEYAAYSKLHLRDAALRLLQKTVKHRSIPPVVFSRRRIVREIRHIRDLVLQKIPARDDAHPRAEAPPGYYILKRSEEPSFYAADGGRATTPTYGTGRRSLVGIDEAARALSRGAQTVTVFEPGRHTLAEQIRAFRDCKGIIAIRGAELANVVWLDAASRAVVINAGTFHLSASPAWGLARLLGIEYAEIDWGTDPYPELTPELIECIRRHIEN